MKVAAAEEKIDGALAQMADLYLNDVFDEWILLSLLPGESGVVSYSGPRENEYEKSFREDIKPLKAEISSGAHGVGDFAFSDKGEGQRHDAFIVAGKGLYLVCNNTELGMPEIQADELWRKAQKPFVQLSEAFRSDPLVLEES